MVARAREFMLARPATEDTVTAVRGATLERLRELVVDAELWQMRRAVSQRHPEFAAGLVGANALAEKAIAQAACERLGADPLTDVTPMATAYAALGAIRAALQQHVSAGFAGSIEERIDAALAAVGLWPRP